MEAIIFSTAVAVVVAVTGATILLSAVPSASWTQESSTTTSNTLPLPKGTQGPSSFAMDSQLGGPYTGISNGRILKYNFPFGFQNFATTAANRNSIAYCDGVTTIPNATVGTLCGRPLGITFNNASYLYICDAFLGLYVVRPSGGEATSLLSATTSPTVRFCNGLDIDPITGVVYFVTSSDVFNYINFEQSIGSGDRTGRLLSYDPRTGQGKVLATGLYGPCGVALAEDSSYVMITEYSGSTLKKLFLTGPRADTVETLLTGRTRPGYIRRVSAKAFSLVHNPQPFVHRELQIDESGTVLTDVSVAGPYTNIKSISDFYPAGKVNFVGSQSATFAGVVPGI